MRARLFKRTKSSWSIILTLGRDKTGRYRQKWITVRGNKKTAEARLHDIVHQYNIDGFIDYSKGSFADYLIKWLGDTKANITPSTFERNDSIVRRHILPDLGHIKLTQIQPMQLQNHYTKKLDAGLKPLTVRRHHTVIHKALADALKHGLVARNVADAVSPPKRREIIVNTWDIAELNHFLEATKNHKFYPLFYLALFTGMRRSELLGLRWSDVDMLGAEVSVNRSLHQLRDRSYIFSETKTKAARRIISISPSTVKVLRDYRATLKRAKNSETVFTRDGKPLRPMTVSAAWRAACRQSGVKYIRFHDARHTHASLMLKQGIHPKIVQERLGHSSIQITLDTYSHVLPGLQEAAAERFDEVLNKKPIRSSFVAD